MIDLSHVLIGANIATVCTALYASFKLVWWLSKLDAKVKEHTDDINNAHNKIRDLEKRAMNRHG